MVRRIAAVVAATASVAAVAAGSGSATTVGGCPSGGGADWRLVEAATFFGISTADVAAIPGMDQNGDGQTCVRQVVNFPIEGRNNWLWRDNTTGNDS